MAKFGYVALLGKPNVGKSTLLNAMVGQKVSIVSNKPQTTRRRVLGIAQGPDYQVAFIDTPGVHEPHTKLGRSMVQQAKQALAGIDLLVAVVNGAQPPGDEDREIARLVSAATGRGLGSPGYKPTTFVPPVDGELPAETGRVERDARGSQDAGTPVLICLNKMDLLKAENVALHVHLYTDLFGSQDYMLTTATRGLNVDKLMRMIVERLPEGEPQFPPDEFTDQSSRFMVAELVREKVLAATRQEVPHAVAVLVDGWEEDGDLLRIEASVLVEKSSQRAILIGKGGAFLKQVGTQARLEIEQLLGRHVFLRLHVKVEEGWRQNTRVLRELEYAE